MLAGALECSWQACTCSERPVTRLQQYEDRMSNLDKLDLYLLEALNAFEESGAQHSASAGITVSLEFEGDLAAIEALGFETDAVQGNTAQGIVWFKDIRGLVELPNLLLLETGSESEANLDHAVYDINARAEAPGGVAGGSGLWFADEQSGEMENGAIATGAGVIVAFIDSGIDYTHPAFLRQVGGSMETRILRIWDQGEPAVTAADSPVSSLLFSGFTYGVEYDSGDINAALNPRGAPLSHKDHTGHGTHLAAIAAGGKEHAPNGDASKVGVAPEADIIVVKATDVPRQIHAGTATAVGVRVFQRRRIRDAVMYCLRIAAAAPPRGVGPKPVVINISLGGIFHAGDGLDSEAIWIDELLSPSNPGDGGVLEFPKGAIVVKAAGNSGATASPHDKPRKRRSAKFTIPALGSLTIPIQLRDKRGGLDTIRLEGKRTTFAPPVGVTFWYRQTTPPEAMKFAVRLPHRNDFSLEQTVGKTFSTSFRVSPPLPFTTSLHPVSKSRHTITLKHKDNARVFHPDLKFIHRKNAFMQLDPKQVGKGVYYLPGIYEVRIKNDSATDIEVYAMCDHISWATGLSVSCEIGEKMQDGTDAGPAITNALTSKSSAVDTLGRNAITVAAYDDANRLTLHLNHHAIAKFSSRGPLRDFSDPADPVALLAPKPDIAAPGVDIVAALSRDTKRKPGQFRTNDWYAGDRVASRDGTSMAAPIVTGVVALMFNKNNDLNVEQVLKALKEAGRPGILPVTPPDPPQSATDVFGGGMVDARASYDKTPQ